MFKVFGIILFSVCHITRLVAVNRVTLRCSSTGLSGLPGLEPGQSGWSYEQKEAVKRLQTRIKQIQGQLTGLSSNAPPGAPHSQQAETNFRFRLESHPYRSQTSFQSENSFQSLESKSLNHPTPNFDPQYNYPNRPHYSENPIQPPSLRASAFHPQSSSYSKESQFNVLPQSRTSQTSPLTRSAKSHSPSIFETFRSISSDHSAKKPASPSSSKYPSLRSYSRNSQLSSTATKPRIRLLSEIEESSLTSSSPSKTSIPWFNFRSRKEPDSNKYFRQKPPPSKSSSIPSYLTRSRPNAPANTSPRSGDIPNKSFDDRYKNPIHLLPKARTENLPHFLSFSRTENPSRLSTPSQSANNPHSIFQLRSRNPSHLSSANPSHSLPPSSSKNLPVPSQKGASILSAPPMSRSGNLRFAKKNLNNSPLTNSKHSSISPNPSPFHSNRRIAHVTLHSSTQSPSPRKQWHHVYSDHFNVKSPSKPVEPHLKLSKSPTHHLKFAEGPSSNTTFNNIYEAFDIGYHVSRSARRDQALNPVVFDNLTSQTSPEDSNQLLHCDKLRTDGFDTDGSYSIDIDGTNAQVFCEFHEDGQNWLVIQRRKDGSEDFYRGWLDYERGFGNTRGEFWIGLSHLHKLTGKRIHQLLIELEDFEGNKAFAKYSVFFVGNPTSSYPINIYGYSGTAGDSLSYHDRYPFSTKDRDHDSNYRANCAASNRGAWWYNSCQHSNLNGEYIPGGVVNIRGIGWYSWKRSHYSMKKSTMKIQPV